MEGRVMVVKGVLGGERVRHGRGIEDAAWGRDGIECDDGEMLVGM